MEKIESSIIRYLKNITGCDTVHRKTMFTVDTVPFSGINLKCTIGQTWLDFAVNTTRATTMPALVREQQNF